MMDKYLNHFLNGYNVNFMTYGQTGTGKTYTLLGPPGSFKEYQGSMDEVPDNFGILSRLVVDLLSKKGDAMLTMNAVQANWKIPIDILTGSNIMLDFVLGDFSG